MTEMADFDSSSRLSSLELQLLEAASGLNQAKLWQLSVSDLYTTAPDPLPFQGLEVP